jgi:hypothetical protein
MDQNVSAYERQDGTAVDKYARRSHRYPRKITKENARDYARKRAHLSLAASQMADHDPLAVEPILMLPLHESGQGWYPITIEEEVYIGPDGDYAGIVFEGCKLPNAKLFNGNFHEGELNQVTLTDADMSKSKLTRTSFFYNRMQGINLSDVDATKAIFSYCDLRYGNFEGANLTGALFGGTDLRHVNWKNTTTSNMILSYDKINNIFPYHQLSLFEAMETLKLSKEDFSITVWAEHLEVRDNETLEIVTTNFDGAKHHVPPWALQNFQPLI